MKIIVDAMGGDNAPLEIVKGALAGQKHWGVDIALTGDESAIRDALAQCGQGELPQGVEIVPTSQTVDMCDDPATVFRRKKDTSMGVGLTMLREGKADALVSAGSTGALLTGATLITKRIHGIRRAAMAPVIPTTTGQAVLIDCGANADCKPDYLVQFALMGQAYMKGVMGIANPKVGLLNVGAEDEKGNELCKAVFPLLKDHPGVNFYGNVEARDVLTGVVQVIVCDGFSGNILLKSTEGAAQLIFGKLKKGLMSSVRSKLGALMVKPALKTVKNELDYEQYGGAALLGVKGALVKAHGSSKGHAYACAIAQAHTMVKGGVVGIIAQSLEESGADSDKADQKEE